MKTLVIYHAPHCNDGFTAAWVAYHGIKNLNPDSTVMLYPMSYKVEDDLILLEHLIHEKYDWIYVVDFSIRLMVIDQMVTRQPDMIGMTILDHHKTAFEMYTSEEVTPQSSCRLKVNNDKVLIILNNAMSGAAIAWYHWNTADMHPLVAHVQDRDLYKFKLEHTRAIHMYLVYQDFTIENWNRIAAALDKPEGYANIVGQGTELLLAYNEEVQNIASDAETCTILGEPGLMVSCPGKYASDVGHVLAGICSTYGMMYYEVEGGDKLYCSLRSDGDFDVSAIAKKFGGGGHKNAAGFVIDIETMEKAFAQKYTDTREQDV